jgi:hypothetical protein
VSALLAIEQTTGTVLTLTLSQFETAAAITRRWADNALCLVDALGRTTFLKHCDEVLQTVRTHPAGLQIGQLPQRPAKDS